MKIHVSITEKYCVIKNQNKTASLPSHEGSALSEKCFPVQFCLASQGCGVMKNLEKWSRWILLRISYKYIL